MKLLDICRRPVSVRGRHIGALAVVLLVSGFYVRWWLPIGWVPSDEGTLADSAARVAAGQLPHRDFAEIYTGGLSLLHGLVFHVWGLGLLHLRYCAMAVFLLTLVPLYAIVARFVQPAMAMLVLFAAVFWSYPNYVAAMPSWYNLFAAVWAAAAACRFIDTGRRRWLMAAGACAGLSVLVKVTGLYCCAALFCFALFCEAEGGTCRMDRRGRFGRLVALLTGAAGPAVFLVALVSLLHRQLGTAEGLHFLLPSAVCVAVILAALWNGYTESRLSLAGISASLGAVSLGIALPCVLFAGLYLPRHGLPALGYGVASSVLARTGGLAGRLHPPGLLETFLYGGVTALLLFAAKRFRVPWLIVTVVGAGLTGDVLSTLFRSGFPDEWYFVSSVLPWLCLLCAGSLFSGQGTAFQRKQTVLFLLLASMCSLVQFPFPWVTYFCYAGPLVLLLVLAYLHSAGAPRSPALQRVLFFIFALLGAVVMNPHHMFNPDLQLARLHTIDAGPAAGLRVDGTTADYALLLALIRSHTGPDRMLYAGNDCPELYLLGPFHNPTRDDTGAPTAEVERALQDPRLKVVVVNGKPFFASGRMDAALYAEVARSFPHRQVLDRFEVFWR